MRQVINKKLCIITSLIPRSETVVQLLTTAELKTGILRKTGAAPGVYMVQPLNTVDEGKCTASIVSVNDREVTTEVATVEIEVAEDEAIDVKLTDEVWIVSREYKVRELRKQVRLWCLSSRERTTERSSMLPGRE
jgi:hypothetical protein